MDSSIGIVSVLQASCTSFKALFELIYGVKSAESIAAIPLPQAQPLA
jgi:hypothetical protein